MGEICIKAFVVKWIECRITEREVEGSNPGKIKKNSLSKINSVYRCKGGDRQTGQSIVRGCEGGRKRERE